MYWQPPVDTTQTVLAGVPTQTLQTWLAQAQQAMNDLMVGGKPVVVSYTQGDGAKTVTYHKTDMQNLNMYIKQLQVQLGISRGRARPLRPVFSGR